MKNLFLFIFILNSLESYSQSKLIAKQFAHDAAVRLMRSISPNSGRDVAAYVSDVEYDYKNQQYIIEMEASWMAGVCYLCSLESFTVAGILRVDDNGYSPSFKELRKSDSVRRAWSDGQVAVIFSTVVALSQN